MNNTKEAPDIIGHTHTNNNFPDSAHGDTPIPQVLYTTDQPSTTTDINSRQVDLHTPKSVNIPLPPIVIRSYLNLILPKQLVTCLEDNDKCNLIIDIDEFIIDSSNSVKDDDNEKIAEHIARIIEKKHLPTIKDFILTQHCKNADKETREYITTMNMFDLIELSSVTNLSDIKQFLTDHKSDNKKLTVCRSRLAYASSHSRYDSLYRYLETNNKKIGVLRKIINDTKASPTFHTTSRSHRETIEYMELLLARTNVQCKRVCEHDQPTKCQVELIGLWRAIKLFISYDAWFTAGGTENLECNLITNVKNLMEINNTPLLKSNNSTTPKSGMKMITDTHQLDERSQHATIKFSNAEHSEWFKNSITSLLTRPALNRFENKTLESDVDNDTCSLEKPVPQMAICQRDSSQDVDDYDNIPTETNGKTTTYENTSPSTSLKKAGHNDKTPTPTTQGNINHIPHAQETQPKKEVPTLYLRPPSNDNQKEQSSPPEPKPADNIHHQLENELDAKRNYLEEVLSDTGGCMLIPDSLIETFIATLGRHTQGSWEEKTDAIKNNIIEKSNVMIEKLVTIASKFQDSTKLEIANVKKLLNHLKTKITAEKLSRDENQLCLYLRQFSNTDECEELLINNLIEYISKLILKTDNTIVSSSTIPTACHKTITADEDMNHLGIPNETLTELLMLKWIITHAGYLQFITHNLLGSDVQANESVSDIPTILNHLDQLVALKEVYDLTKNALLNHPTTTTAMDIREGIFLCAPHLATIQQKHYDEVPTSMQGQYLKYLKYICNNDMLLIKKDDNTRAEWEWLNDEKHSPVHCNAYRDTEENCRSPHILPPSIIKNIDETFSTANTALGVVSSESYIHQDKERCILMCNILIKITRILRLAGYSPVRAIYIFQELDDGTTKHLPKYFLVRESICKLSKRLLEHVMRESDSCNDDQSVDNTDITLSNDVNVTNLNPNAESVLKLNTVCERLLQLTNLMDAVKYDANKCDELANKLSIEMTDKKHFPLICAMVVMPEHLKLTYAKSKRLLTLRKESIITSDDIKKLKFDIYLDDDVDIDALAASLDCFIPILNYNFEAAMQKNTSGFVTDLLKGLGYDKVRSDWRKLHSTLYSTIKEYGYSQIKPICHFFNSLYKTKYSHSGSELIDILDTLFALVGGEEKEDGSQEELEQTLINELLNTVTMDMPGQLDGSGVLQGETFDGNRPDPQM